MTQTTPKRPRRRGRLFPEYTIPPEELARRQAEKDARSQRNRQIFVQVISQLIENHYNWFIVI